MKRVNTKPIILSIFANINQRLNGARSLLRLLITSAFYYSASVSSIKRSFTVNGMSLIENAYSRKRRQFSRFYEAGRNSSSSDVLREIND